MALTISTVEVLSLNTLLVVFSEPLSTLPANYEPGSYTISGLTIRSVIPPTTVGAPIDLVLVTDKMVVGSAYILSALGLEPASAEAFDGTATVDFSGHETKLDKVLSSIPTLYDTAPDSTVRQILTAIHRENGKIGGEGTTVFTAAEIPVPPPEQPEIAALVSHLDFSTIDSVTFVSTVGPGEDIATALDQAALLDWDAFVSTGTPATWEENQYNGLGCINFVGDLQGSYIQYQDAVLGSPIPWAPSPAASLDGEIFMVARKTSTDSIKINALWRMGAAEGGSYAGIGNGTDRNKMRNCFGSNNVFPHVSLTPVDVAQSLFLMNVWSATDDHVTNMNEVVQAAYTSSSRGWTAGAWYLGRSAGNQNAQMDLCEVLIYNKKLDAEERAGVVAYLKAKWDVPY